MPYMIAALLKKSKTWMTNLKKCTTEAFGSGYYLGQKLGEWSDTSGSQLHKRKYT